jgi:RNA polymerase sigma factor (sigma-70 family)
MAKGQRGGALRDVQMLLKAGTTGGLTDGQLLEDVRGQCGEARERAFAALVERHGPAVLRACRSILRDEHAAEDAFQAAFLVLARKAGSLRVRDSLAPWLHQVACRVAWCARAAAARRRRHERRAAELADPSGRDPGVDDLGPLIHEEIDRLPGRYRAPIVLCFLEGLTREQAAGQLRWPLGTLQSRLARGRERLRRILHTKMAPYSLFERGPEQWVEIAFERPVELPGTFWVALDFRANQTKGVYVSYDASTRGRHSLVGLPGTPAARPRLGGDWMIEALLAE